MATTDTITQPATDRGSRLHGLDALRGGALLLGIVLHSLLPFALQGAWLVNDRHNSTVAAATIHVIHLFRMPLFLLLAGYFARLAWYRKGLRGFVVDRLKRIGLPLVAFWPIAVGSLGALVVLNLTLRGGELPTPPGSQPGDQPQAPGPGQLWFLVVLLECYLIMILVRALVRAVLGSARTSAISHRVATVLTSPGGVLLAMIPYAAGVLLQGDPVGGGLREPITFIPEPRGLVAYFGAFAVGWAFHSRPDALSRVTRGVWIYLPVAAVTATTSLLLSDPAGNLPPVVIAVVAGIASWTSIYALLGLGLRFLDRERPAVRYLADASYWMYLLHLPLLVAIEIPLAELGWPILIKLLITWVITFTVLVLSYHLLVRSTWIGKWLNGRKHPWSWPPLR
jgi:glucan biosynthesis protein C